MKAGQPLSPKSAMKLALQSAKKGVGFVSPNPPVGCVILDRDHKFLSEGYHQRYGGKHAEIIALNKIKQKELLTGAFVYITLEPCAHFGKTPPCVETLVQYPLARVVYGMKDPNPKTNGAGIDRLNLKGIQTEPFSCFKKDIKRLYEVFSFNMRERRAWVALKVAVTLDGIMALSDGSSQWISSEISRKYVSHLRGCYDGVLVGAGTFLQDNPRLNSRHSPYQDKKNKVIIVDPKGVSLEHIKSSYLAQVRPLSHIIVIVADSLKVSLNLPEFVLKKYPLDEEGRFNLRSILSDLYREEGINSLLVEGGEAVFSSFLQQKSAQRFYQFVSPRFLGGNRGRGFTGSFRSEGIDHAPFLRDMDIVRLGPDFLITGLL